MVTRWWRRPGHAQETLGVVVHQVNREGETVLSIPGTVVLAKGRALRGRKPTAISGHFSVAFRKRRESRSNDGYLQLGERAITRPGRHRTGNWSHSSECRFGIRRPEEERQRERELDRPCAHAPTGDWEWGWEGS